MTCRKIIIPKGTIGGNQTTIIRIPDNLYDDAVVISPQSLALNSGFPNHFQDHEFSLKEPNSNDAYYDNPLHYRPPNFNEGFLEASDEPTNFAYQNLFGNQIANSSYEGPEYDTTEAFSEENIDSNVLHDYGKDLNTTINLNPNINGVLPTKRTFKTPFGNITVSVSSAKPPQQSQKYSAAETLNMKYSGRIPTNHQVDKPFHGLLRDSMHDLTPDRFTSRRFIFDGGRYLTDNQYNSGLQFNVGTQANLKQYDFTNYTNVTTPKRDFSQMYPEGKTELNRSLESIIEDTDGENVEDHPSQEDFDFENSEYYRDVVKEIEDLDLEGLLG